jgi:hypothetical protein
MFVARTNANKPRIVVQRDGLLAFDPAPSSRPAPLDAFLRWEIAAAGDRCGPTAVSWIDGEDRVVWQAAVPARMHALSFGPCNELKVVTYRRLPRLGSPFVANGGYLIANAVVVVVDSGGVWLLRKTDGATLLDVATNDSTSNPNVGLFFDGGEYVFDGTCRGRAYHGATFALCGDHVVYFNGKTALLVDIVKLRVDARASYPKNATIRSTGLHTDVTIHLGTHELALRGETYMK